MWTGRGKYYKDYVKIIDWKRKKIYGPCEDNMY
jgi:hypothetical protein